MLKTLTQFLSSLRLTVVLLACAIAVVFFGTLGQTSDGLYVAQQRYFRSWFSYWTPHDATFPWIPLPGGYLVGTLLLANLTVAHVTRFKWSWNKSGIFMTHIGIILLLVGQLLTDMLARESVMSFREGESRNYSESSMDFELAFLQDSGSNQLDQVIAFPANLIKSGTELQHPLLPFLIRVREAFENATVRVRGPMVDSNRPPASTQGAGRSMIIESSAAKRGMDDRNVPGSVLEMIDGGRSMGTWLGSGILRAQQIETASGTWRMELRPVREYKPFALTLIKTTHEVYPGTEKPKNFQSRVRIQNLDSREDREVDIYMNNPLRYSGYTFFQFQMGREQLEQGGRGTSALQVVQNPSWIAPYLGCIIVGLGLLVQFGIHLGKFISRRKA